MRTKILLLCLSCTLFALLVQTFFFQYSASAINSRQERESSRNSLESMRDEIYTWIRSYENVLIKIYNQKDFCRDLGGLATIVELQERNTRMANNFVMNIFDPSQNINALYIYDMEDRLVNNYRFASTPHNNYPEDIYSDPEANNARIVNEYVRSDKRTMLVSSYFNTSRKKDIIRFVLKIYGNNATRKIGYLVCDVDSNSLLDILEKYVYSDRQVVWLQPAGDRPALVSGFPQGKQKEFFDEVVGKIRENSWVVGSDRELKPVKGIAFFGIAQKKYNLIASSMTPQYLLEESQTVLTRNLVIIAILMIHVSVVSATLIANTLTNPLQGMVRSLQRIKNGETEIRLTGLASDEIGTLGLTINEMLDRIQNLVAQEFHVRLLLKQAEYKALQAQVNPHFLYNSLDTMSSMAASQSCEIVSTLCRAMSNVFRYSIDMKEAVASIGDEIVHLKNYMFIMNVRTQNSIEFEILIDRALLAEKVPRLTLQPLVENALNHGLKNKRGQKKIVLEAASSGNDILLSVSDNGIGMDAEEINRQLTSDPETVLEKSASIGLANINARIALLFGESYGIAVKSTKGEGSRVTLRIPRKTGEALPT